MKQIGSGSDATSAMLAIPARLPHGALLAVCAIRRGVLCVARPYWSTSSVPMLPTYTNSDYPRQSNMRPSPHARPAISDDISAWIFARDLTRTSVTPVLLSDTHLFPCNAANGRRNFLPSRALQHRMN